MIKPLNLKLAAKLTNFFKVPFHKKLLLLKPVRVKYYVLYHVHLIYNIFETIIFRC